MTVIADAIWSWWIKPLTVVDGTRLWVSTISMSGVNQIHRVVGDTVETVDLGGPETADEHNAGAIAFDPSNPQLLVCYSRHNQDSHVRVRTVDRSSLTVGAERQVEFSGNVSYAQVAVHGGRVWLWCRVPTSEWHYRVSDDWGDTWSPERTMFVRPAGESGQIYMTTAQFGAGVHFATVGHPSSSDYNTIGYCRASLSSGDVTDAAGTVIGNLEDGDGPDLTLDLLDEVYVPPATDSTRLLDVGVVDGSPAVVYATWTKPDDPATYRLARWEPGWTSTDVVASGVPFGYLPETKYLGGVVFDGDDLIVSREDAGTWMVERRSSTDDFEIKQTLTVSNARRVRPAVADGQVMWQRVHVYDHYTEYQSDVEIFQPEGGAEGPGQSVATLQRRVTWLGCDASTGQIIAELPDLTGRVSRLLGADASSSASTPIPLAGPAAVGPAAIQATEPYRTILVAVVNDVPAWVGWVLRREGGTSATLDLGAITPEGYLGRRFVRDHTFTQVDESLAMSTLAADAEDIDGVGRGLGLVHAVTPSGNLVDAEYLASDHGSVLDRMQERSRAEGGVEWTIDPEWLDADRAAVQLVLRIAPRIGTDSGGPVFEVFDSPGGAAVAYSLAEDWSDGRGANYVVAYGVGEGDDQPVSNPAIDQPALSAGAPIVERHWQPSTSIESTSVLNGHAVAELARRRKGTRTWSVRARWDRYPHYGVDWRLGDTVRLEVVGHRHPSGVSVTARTIGWDLDLAAGLIEPKLESV